MTPEMNALIQNGKSIFEQLEHLTEGGSDMTAKAAATGDNEISPEDVEKVLKMMKDFMGGTDAAAAPKTETLPPTQGDETDPAKKAQKSDEGTHGDDTAEAVIDDQDKTSLENQSEVAKAFKTFMKAMKVKSVSKSGDDELRTVVKAQSEEIKTLKQNIGIILEGYGIADMVTKSIKSDVKPMPGARTFENQDAMQIAKSIEELKGFAKQAVGKDQPSNQGWGWPDNGRQSVRKSLINSIGNNVAIIKDPEVL
jgi:hypothetical protein